MVAEMNRSRHSHIRVALTNIQLNSQKTPPNLNWFISWRAGHTESRRLLFFNRSDSTICLKCIIHIHYKIKQIKYT